jgi:hypothetical protein
MYVITAIFGAPLLVAGRHDRAALAANGLR